MKQRIPPISDNLVRRAQHGHHRGREDPPRAAGGRQEVQHRVGLALQGYERTQRKEHHLPSSKPRHPKPPARQHQVT